MIDSGTDAVIEYVGNGASDTFSITFPTFEDENVVVEVEDSGGVITSLTQDVDYSLSNIGIPNQDATLTLIDAGQSWVDGDGDLDTGFTLRIKFSTDVIQPSKFRDLGKLAPEAFEKVLDRFAMFLLAIKSTGSIVNVTNREISIETANFTLDYDKEHIVTTSCNAQLPAPVDNGRVKLKILGAITVTVLRDGAEDIDGVAADIVLDSEDSAYTLGAKSGNWYILA